MTPWQPSLVKALSQPDAPPVLSRDLLKRYARAARGDRPVPDSTLTWWIRRAAEEGKLEAVQRGLYLNRVRGLPGRLADAVSNLQRDSVVSLNTVLGDAGVLNNPTRTVTAVVPIDAGYPPKLGRKRTKAGTVHFYGIPRRFLEAGDPLDRLEPIERFEHARATPEKALIDWLYLGRSARSSRTPPVLGDIDVELLNRRRLNRLAKAAGLSDALQQWLNPQGR